MKSEASLKQFYVAVGTSDAKMSTLVDLLLALHASKRLALAVCCGSRDSLDSVVAGLGTARRFKIFPLFAELSEAERTTVIQNFQASQSSSGEQAGSSEATDQGDENQRAGGRPQASVLVVTDAVLKATKGSLGLELVIHYDAPSQKEDYNSRVSTLFGGGRDRRGGLHVSINFVSAGEVEQFRNLDGFSSQPIEAMPIHVSDIFGAHHG